MEGRYRVVRELGRGGMAVVYLAEDLKHRRPVALKVMKPEVAHGLGADRFLREIEIAARITHPNILPLHDSGQADGLLYFVMPCVEGETLRERLQREGPLGLDEAIRIAREVADALGFAHAQGLVHRDIKPENILFQAGHAMVSDFGIAKALSTAGGSGLTETGFAVGTLKYMSPEQAAGGTGLDARSDVYSLGCVFFEMLTGAAPFAGSTPPAMLARKVMGPPPRLSEVRRDAPPTLDDVIATALAPDPDTRFDTPGAFAAAVVEAATARAVEADVRRRRRATGVRRVVALTTSVVIGGAAWWTASLLDRPTFERVAVLPLRVATNDPELDYFVEGLHEDLIRELMRAGVRVINPTSVRQYRNSERPIRDIARDLGVDAIVQGSADLASDAVSLDLYMTHGLTDEVVWADSFGGAVEGVRGVYSDVVRAIAGAMGLELSDDSEARLASQPPVDPRVQEDLWWARFHRSKLSEEGLSLALGYFQRALERDPDNVEALVGVAGVWSGRAQMGFVSSEEAQGQGDAAWARAMAIDSMNSGLQASLAATRTWIEWDFEAAEQTFARALAADPTNSVNRALHSHLLHYLGRDDEARAEIRLALEQDPLNAQIRTYYGMELLYERDYARADSVLRSVIADEPDYRMALTTLRTTYHLTGEHELAMDMWRASNARDPDALVALDRGYSADGYHQALRSLAELLVARSDTMHVTPWQIGTLYTRAGDGDLALAHLERAFEERDPNIPYLTVDPIFDFLRTEPRFRALIRRLGLPE